MAKCVLHVEDDPTMLKAVRLILEEAGFRVVSAESGAEAMRHLAMMQPSLLLIDVTLGSESGYALCREIHERYPDLGAAVAFLTAARSIDDIRTARAVGGHYFIVKPITPASLVAGVGYAFAAHSKATRQPAAAP